MDLVCANKVRTNFMISAHYIAQGVSGLLLFALPDLLGRKKTMNCNFFVYTGAQYLLIFVPTFWARYAGFVLFGLSKMKNSVCYVWISELVPIRHKNSALVSLTSFDSGTLGFLCLYFVLASREWFPIMMVTTLLSTLALLILIVVLPESPIWLLQKGRQQEAIDALNLIGWINGVSKRIPSNAQFIEAR